MPTVAILCPSCWKSGQVPDSYVGKTVTCPACRAKIPVTAPDDFKGAMPAAPAPTVPATALNPPAPSPVPQPVVVRAASPVQDDPWEGVGEEDGGIVSVAVGPEPWYYGFLDRWSRFWMGVGVALFLLGFAANVLLVMGGHDAGLGPATLIGALVVAAAGCLAVLIAGAFVLLAVDMGRNLREVRRQGRR